MSRRLNFDTMIDEAARMSGMTCKEFAESCLLSATTLLKARSGDPARGGLHWTSLALVGIRIGFFGRNEQVDQHDPRLRTIHRGIISYRGRGAPRYREIFN